MWLADLFLLCVWISIKSGCSEKIVALVRGEAVRIEPISFSTKESVKIHSYFVELYMRGGGSGRLPHFAKPLIVGR